ncbi:polyphosphate kinase 1 [Thalassotalea sp. PP2-459]|uniref:polyphosphate kinase 1 n=1 Tax=Thalassotalea sp. PP2-459 TaxID=1742724 RepID=UPI00094371E9|nr:polyphosphate kinase 1 [Thalassotalea sp. PP2-459]OKY25949.1 RNA degradosome polyphosphate kinase [Thalassotalea sp. PP2-459]
MIDKELFFDKELSWLSFNERVLQEAGDEQVPLIERIRFLAIYSANLDEFFRVRVAKLRRKLLLERATNEGDKDSAQYLYLKQLLSEINHSVSQLTEKFRLYAQHAFAQLKEHNIELLFNEENSTAFNIHLTPEEKRFITTFYHNHIVRFITPIFINSNTQLVSCLDDDGIYFLVALKQTDDVQYALIEIPRSEVDRFIILPKENHKNLQRVVMLDDVVHFFLGDVFDGIINYTSIEAYSLKLTRDAEYDLNDELDQSLLDKMSKGLKQRLTAEPVRLGYDKNMPDYMLKYLRKALKIKDINDLIPGVRYRHYKDFIAFPNLGGPELENQELPALDATGLVHKNLSFDAIRAQDILVYYPYYKFRHFTEFVRKASYDPLVKTIKINIYRVAKKSEIIHSLMEAVKNGKQVTVVVELRARFDEQTNITWAHRMKDAGINVEFGIDTLKIHSKLCLITRIENDKIVRYAHIGTGNFHEKNARIYTDFSLFTHHKEITQEVDNVFSFIAHSYKRFRFNHLIVSPLTSRRRIYQLIDNEIEHAKHNKKATITLKVNNLVDIGLINKLYNASNAGVIIKIIVRGMCSLIPGKKGMSKNIHVISIVDRFLEHPRIMLFHNNGVKSLYISSADWMERNIDQRVEVACPIYDPVLKKRIIEILDIQLKDNQKARLINEHQDNTYVPQGNKQPIRSQILIYNYLAEQESNERIALQNTDK